MVTSSLFLKVGLGRILVEEGLGEFMVEEVDLVPDDIHRETRWENNAKLFCL